MDGRQSHGAGQGCGRRETDVPGVVRAGLQGVARGRHQGLATAGEEQ